MWQWRLIAPFLAPTTDDTAQIADFAPETILPWSRFDVAPETDF
jgi:hypothetical protein